MTIVTFHASRKLRSEFIRLLHCHENVFSCTVEPYNSTKRIPRRMTAEEERRIYFSGYNKAWN